MDRTEEMRFGLYKVDLLWFEKYSAENPDVEEFLGMPPEELAEPDSPENPMFVMTCGYDYGVNSDGVKEVYMDSFTKLPHYGALKLRSYYEIENKTDFEWDDVFLPERFRVIVENATQNGLKNFVTQCEAQGVKLSPEMLAHQPDTPREQIDALTANLINDYFDYRKPFMEGNAEAINMHALTIPPNQNWTITLHLTLLVMEEVLFNNLHFNRRKNREKFFEVVPESSFYSLRNKCILLNKQEITFNQLEIHYWLIAQDCALQMAMGEKGDALTPIMVSRGFTAEIQKIWHTGAGKIVEMCRGTVEVSIASKEKFDWYKILS